MRGAAFALGLPRADPSKDDGTRLLTRTAAGSAELEAALDELAGEGASIIIGGLDVESVDRTIAWSRRTGVAVITLVAPRIKPEKGSFVCGEAPQRVVSVLAEALGQRRFQRAATVLGTIQLASVDVSQVYGVSLLTPVPCDAMVDASSRQAAHDAWKRAQIRAWIVSGSDSCAHNTLEIVRGIVALSLEATAAGNHSTAQVKVIGLGAGRVPYRPDAKSKTPKDEMGEYALGFGARPAWWASIGHDAALLAFEATRTLPADTTSVSDEVAKRREIARSALESANTTKLWTTDATAFSGDHTLARTLTILEIAEK